MQRQKRAAENAAAAQAAKMARLDGSANKELAGDGSAVLTGRVEFSSARFRVKAVQPTVVSQGLVGGMLAKIFIVANGDGVRTEVWDVGRLKAVKEISVTLPQGGAAVSALLFVWQALNKADKAAGLIINDMSLKVAGCGRNREWVMVEPTPIGLNTAGRGRPPGRGRGGGRGKGGRGRGAAQLAGPPGRGQGT